MNYREKLDAFKSSCRVYKQEKDHLEALINENRENPSRQQYLQYVKEDVAFVEDTLKKIDEKCGTNARVMIWDLFIENKTQAAVAQEYGVTRRQVQHAMDKWMHAVLEEEQS